jgi:[acyl-carrier-protein] S-malonyltransferase
MCLGLKLVKLRSEAMQGSCLEVPSGMLTVIGLDQDRLDDCCRRVNTDSDPISISIHLFPSGFAVAGTLKALALLKDVVINEGASNVKDVLVSGGFHSKLMDSAVLKFKKAVESTHISFPEIPVYSNVTGNVYTNVDEIRELLPLQLVRPVLWNESMCGMINKFGEEHFSEIGPGKSLKLILRRINKNAFATCINYEI